MRAFVRWFGGTSNRTFVACPIAIVAIESARAGGVPRFEWLGVPLMAGGYLLYKLCGRYRTRLGGGGPGVAVPPERLVTSGPYRFVRNPMYAGHLVFTLGLAIAFRSWIAGGLLVASVVWFDRRVRRDEARLAGLFGPVYADYAARVKRWVPGVV